MYKFYTAAGRLHMNGSVGGKKCPAVILRNREFILDIQEMMVWTILNWRILDDEETLQLYEAKEREVGYQTHRDFYDCLHRLVQRGLVAEGYGKTPENALYDLLSELYIVPISENIFLRILSFIKLTLFNGVPFSVTKKILLADKRSENEKKVMRLAKQALLSTAEIIKCVETSSLALRNEGDIMDAIYGDTVTTSDNLPMFTKSLSACRPVITSIANLYLRKQIIFERVS